MIFHVKWHFGEKVGGNVAPMTTNISMLMGAIHLTCSVILFHGR